VTGDHSKKDARIFFALWPDDAERAALAAWQPSLVQLCGGRLIPGENLHNTLVFLGNVAIERLEALQLAAQEVVCAKFRMTFNIARYWGHNQIVYAAPGVVPPPLKQLVKELEQKLLLHHFSFERRSYKPHVTLLRHARWTDTPLPAMLPVVWAVQDFVLVQSVSEGQGVRYEILARFALA
jgi:RNA 2',3'-cyclic 3'-phosphodiesterase